MKSTLVVNAGSSSIKAALFQAEEEIWRKEGDDYSIFNALPKQPIDLVGHRIVHGGPNLTKSCHITKEVEEQIASLVAIDPLHALRSLEGIRQTNRRFPKAQHYAVFDTAFHQSLPPVAYTYAGPRSWLERGIRKYGFHGISFAYLSTQVKEKRAILCHLGAGASLCALYNQKSIDTTMGFSPLDGLMMASRCGALDPMVPLFLAKVDHVSPEKLEKLLNEECGLQGLCQESSMEMIEKRAATGDPQASFAIDLFCYRFQQQCAQMLAALNDVDALVFTAGIGEHSPRLRQKLMPKFLDIEIDEEKNVKNARLISKPSSKVAIYVIPTKEELWIAKEGEKLLS